VRFGDPNYGNLLPMGRPKHERRIHNLRHAYSEWRWRSAGVWAAYERWTRASGDERTLEFAAYRVALDIEERACREYMHLAERVADARALGGSQRAAAA
jgi:hypothetical protein